KLLAVVEIEFRDSVVIGDEQILIAGATQIRRRCSQSPSSRVDADFLTDLFERASTEIAEEILAPAVLRVLKTLRHHLRAFQVPEVDVFGVVAAEKKIQSPVAIV